MSPPPGGLRSRLAPTLYNHALCTRNMNMAELFEFNISTDDRVSQDFGTGLDRIRVSAEAPTSQVRLVFTSSEA